MALLLTPSIHIDNTFSSCGVSKGVAFWVFLMRANLKCFLNCVGECVQRGVLGQDRMGDGLRGAMGHAVYLLIAVKSMG